MLQKIKEFFKGEVSSLEVNRHGQPSEREIRIACAVLLLEMAGADNDYSPAEIETSINSIQRHFSLERHAATELLEIADGVRREAGKIDQFVKTINENYNAKQREQILAMIWRVVVADGNIEKFEQRHATQMKFRLQLDDAASERARQAATAR